MHRYIIDCFKSLDFSCIYVHRDFLIFFFASSRICWNFSEVKMVVYEVENVGDKVEFHCFVSWF